MLPLSNPEVDLDVQNTKSLLNLLMLNRLISSASISLQVKYKFTSELLQ